MLVRWQSRWLQWRRRVSRAEWAARHLGFALSQDPPHAPGLVLIQIDGLSRRQCERAIREGRMPFLRRLLRRGGYVMHTSYSGLPSSTPAVQAELLYGVRTAVPAFSFLDPHTGGIGIMMHPDTVKPVEASLAGRAAGLLTGGSSWSNIYAGGAAPEESHFCAASIGLGDAWRSLKLRLAVLVILVNLDRAFRLLGALALEFGRGLRDALRGIRRRGHRIGKELIFVATRVAVSVGLRELVTFGAAIDIARGLPVVHVNFLGYDEHAHRRGPESLFAHRTLRGIDRCIRRLHRAARRSGRRDYDVWIFSDHGQTSCLQCDEKIPGGLEGLVRKHWPTLTEAAASGGRSQARPSPGHWLGGPRAGRREMRHTAAAQLSAFEQSEFAVAAMGPVGHIYFRRELGPEATRSLAEALVRDGVPSVLWCDPAGGVVWLEAGGEHRLPDDAHLFEVDAELQAEIARDLVALCRHPQAGTLVALGWAPGRRPWSFARENGAHAGPAPDEVIAFALLPPGTWLPAGTEHHVRPELLRRAALRLLGRDPPRLLASSSVRDPGRRLARAPHLRVVTYNVHGCLGADGRISPRRVARVLAQFDADIVAIQELDVGRGRSRGEHQLEIIAGELGLEACFCVAVEHEGGHYGHGLLSRRPMEVVRRDLLPGGPRRAREPRAAVCVSVPWQAHRILVFNTHLGLGGDERDRQIAGLLGPRWVGGVNGDVPVILCGDLNLHPGSRGYRQLAARLRDVQAHAPGHTAQRTFPSVYPVRCLDYVFVSGHFAVHAARVARDALTVLTSDHLPLVCDLELAVSAGVERPAALGAGQAGSSG